MNILRLTPERYISLESDEKIYRGDNEISNLLIYLPSHINEYDINDCSIEARFYIEDENYISYNVETSDTSYEVPITLDITYKAQKIGIILVITHENEIIGSTNKEIIEVFESPEGKDLPPREDLDRIIAEQEETIESQTRTIEEQNLTISLQTEEIETLTSRNNFLENQHIIDQDTIQYIINNPPQPNHEP